MSELFVESPSYLDDYITQETKPILYVAEDVLDACLEEVEK